MDLGLANRRALVSGSTAGIGFGIARELAREGAEVIINGRTQERVEQAIANIRKDVPHAKLQPFAADLSTAQAVAALSARFAELDIVVNNLGIFEPRNFFDIRDEQWTHMFQVNVLSGIRLARAYVPAMRKRGWGRVIFISSESALQIPVEMIDYGMTKTAQLAVASGLAKECAGTGVTVNSILVGPTASEGVGTFVQQMADKQKISREQMEQEFFKTARPTSLLKRFITTQEVANLVAYVASERASATTGAALRVDGGVLAAI